MDQSLLIIIAFSAVACQVLYWATRFLTPLLAGSFYSSLDDAKAEKGYFAATVISTVHAVVVSVLSIASLVQNTGYFSTTDFFMTSIFTRQACAIFIGYTIADLGLSSFFRSAWPGWQANLAHHVCVIAAWWQMTDGSYGQGVATIGMLCEVSTPFVNARWVLDKMGMKTSKLYMINGLLMVFLFFVFRVVLYSWQMVRIYHQSAGLLTLPVLNITVFLFCYFAGVFLQILWFTKMAKGALKLLVGPKKS